MQRCPRGVQTNMHNQQRAGARAHAHGGLGACLGCMPADVWGRKVWVIVLSLARCSPASDHQVAVEAKAGGSPFAASGAQSV